MKTRLDELTLHDLIELTCGNSSVLLQEGETPVESVKIACARQIMTEYKELAAPSQAKIDMIEAEGTTKLRMKEKCVRICMALCSQDHSELAKDVLIELGVSEQFLKDKESIRLRSKAMLDEVLFELKREEEMKEEKGNRKEQTVAEIRKAWFSEIAYVMSMLKMPIEPATINAAVYANLVHQSAERAKQISKMPPMASMFM